MSVNCCTRCTREGCDHNRHGACYVGCCAEGANRTATNYCEWRSLTVFTSLGCHISSECDRLTQPTHPLHSLPPHTRYPLTLSRFTDYFRRRRRRQQHKIAVGEPSTTAQFCSKTCANVSDQALLYMLDVYSHTLKHHPIRTTHDHRLPHASTSSPPAYTSILTKRVTSTHSHTIMTHTDRVNRGSVL